ncbi:hypothetical protein M9H77_35949 [Catharanthus roseus]|uniref:Uncharacterized protein n=1 Tax=Catharanthus roseus TaxID=4058 RepID=A0ACB9ZRD7_CATRO|nr:hypothetical protein M9H77_35949 [Catharanthus roseus]
MKSGLDYTSTNLNHTAGMYVAQHESSYTKFGKLEGLFVKDSLSRAEKRNLIKKHKATRPPLLCDCCKKIGHVNNLISWYSTKQNCISLSTVEFEDSWPCIFSSLPYQGAHGYLSLKGEGQIPFTISNIQAMTRK